MKKLFSLAAAAVTAFSTLAFPIPAAADAEVKLPFELSAPENVTIEYLDGNDSLNTCEIHYSQNSSMSEWSSRINDPETLDEVWQELAKMGYADMWIVTQIDWSIDSQDDWHCNKYWESEGYDEEYRQHLGDWAYISCQYSSETAMSEWIFRYMGNINDPEDRTWNGRHEDGDDYDGWKDVLKEDQYEVVENEDGEAAAKIDLTKHTIYTRVRYGVFCVYDRETNERVFVPSEWSEVAAVGKDAVKTEPIKPGEIAAPVISDLKYTDEEFNGFPVISVKLDVDDTLAAQVAQASGTAGALWLETEARVQGTEDWVGLQGDWTIKSGEMKIDLQALAENAGGVEKDTPIEFRARYGCSQTEQEDIYSDYSEVLVFGSVDMEVTPDSVPEETTTTTAAAPAETTTTTAKEKTEEKDDKCSLCGFCPQPLGLCIFIWIAIIVVIAVIVVVVILMKKKKNTDEPAPAQQQTPKPGDEQDKN
ncbi:MAG: hypothetical protein IJ746_01005 [Ruminococcus sp.]|nr:hypothetical protein [Ruminococcus sp.]